MVEGRVLRELSVVEGDVLLFREGLGTVVEFKAAASAGKSTVPGVQHSIPLSAQKVHTVEVALAGCTEDEQVTAPPAVLFLPQLPHVESDEQVFAYMLDPG